MNWKNYLVKTIMNWKNYLVKTIMIWKNYLIKTIIYAVVGIIIAWAWEYFKFKREVQFERKIDLIIENRKQVADIYVEIDQIRRQITSNEIYSKNNSSSTCDPSINGGYVEQLKVLALRLNYIDELNKNIIKSDSLIFQLERFKNKMKAYIKCVEGNTDCEICSDDDLVGPIAKIIELHTEQILNLVK
ncbi:MAG: hypothetical protein LBG80_16015 [Bacteroidales bacterium]|jgi:hypothetical protein|nr:hypothetical protein [Bacteroidales bacterium]